MLRKSLGAVVVFGCVSFVGSGAASAATLVALNSDAGVDGSGSSTFPFSSPANTVMIQIAADQLSAMAAGGGSVISGIGFRLNGGNTPSSTLQRDFSDYEITLGPAANAFGSINNQAGVSTFASNFGIGSVKVQDGAFSIPAGGIPQGSSPNSFFSISFNTATYTYTGGDLVVLISSTGNGASSYSLDAAGTSDPEYGDLAGRKIFAAGSTQFQNSLIEFAALAAPTLQFDFTAVPEPLDGVWMAGLGLLGFAVWRRSRDQRAAA